MLNHPSKEDAYKNEIENLVNSKPNGGKNDNSISEIEIIVTKDGRRIKYDFKTENNVTELVEKRNDENESY